MPSIVWQKKKKGMKTTFWFKNISGFTDDLQYNATLYFQRLLLPRVLFYLYSFWLFLYIATYFMFAMIYFEISVSVCFESIGQLIN